MHSLHGSNVRIRNILVNCEQITNREQVLTTSRRQSTAQSEDPQPSNFYHPSKIMISFKIIDTQTEIEELKTRTHHKIFTTHVCSQSDRLAYVMESRTTTHNNGKIETSQEIKAFYFGFPNDSQAEKFEAFAESKFPILADYDSHCQPRLGKRLAYPHEVKIRNLPILKDDLLTFFGQCIDQALAPKVVEIDPERDAIMRKKIARF